MRALRFLLVAGLICAVFASTFAFVTPRVTHNSTAFECPKEPDPYHSYTYPDRNDCSRFYTCVNSTAGASESCLPDDMMYDEVKKECTYLFGWREDPAGFDLRNRDCIDHRPQDLVEYCYRRAFARSKSVPDIGSKHVYPGNDSYYYECSWNLSPIRLECGELKRFDAKKKDCVIRPPPDVTYRPSVPPRPDVSPPQPFVTAH